MGCASDDDPTIAQEEARVLSFGTQSYASKIMESMGWKQVTFLFLKCSIKIERIVNWYSNNSVMYNMYYDWCKWKGEALGSSRKGMLEPVEAKGNIGTAGLGWKWNWWCCYFYCSQTLLPLSVEESDESNKNLSAKWTWNAFFVVVVDTSIIYAILCVMTCTD